jgi:hypothetical protein
MSGNAGEMAREMERVARALETARVHIAGLDQADGARRLRDQVAYSPLRTLLEQAEQSAATVIGYLRGEART